VCLDGEGDSQYSVATVSCLTLAAVARVLSLRPLCFEC
jgi:hypothetical protein